MVAVDRCQFRALTSVAKTTTISSQFLPFESVGASTLRAQSPRRALPRVRYLVPEGIGSENYVILTLTLGKTGQRFHFSRRNSLASQRGLIVPWTHCRNLVASGVILSLVATPALAEKANQLIDVNGMDAWGAEQALKSRGFKSISSHKNSHGHVISYWWDGKDNNCVRVDVSNDTVQQITDAKDRDCNHSSGGDVAAAAGVVAGAAILGAILSHKSHHTDGKDYNDQQTQEFERGYKDGLHGGSYHNYNRDEAYSHGYEAGTNEREANLSHHDRRGGYSNYAQYADLKGARAAGGMDELNRRGFVQVDNFTSGNTRYSIRWREASRQCLQVTVADGRLYSLDDIRTHPKCHSGGGYSSSGDPGTWYGRLVGAANDGAEVQLRNNGFSQAGSYNTGSSGHGYYWYNRSTKQCLAVETSHGRVSSSEAVASRKCR